MLHIDDQQRAALLAGILGSPARPDARSMPIRELRTLYMFMCAAFPDCRLSTLQATIDSLWASGPIRDEVIEVLQILSHRTGPAIRPLDQPDLRDVPICVHGTYTQDEIMAAFGMENPAAMRQGVRYFGDQRCDVFLVTLRKTDTEYSPTTRYDDYAISQSQFHWESQSTTSSSSPTGQRYINHERDGSHVLLFVRESRLADRRTMPYFCVGPVRYCSHDSDRPMRIIWNLDHRLPHATFLSFRAAAG
jgi:hypothetical protein